MGYGKGKSEGGQGGKLGHGNMSHRDPTEWVKEQSKVRRRNDDKKSVRTFLNEFREVEFEFTFNRELNDEEEEEFYDDFIETIEKENLYWGGGGSRTYITGCLDLIDSKLEAEEVIQLLNKFAEKRQDIVKKLTSEPYVEEDSE